jgi:hypothetical protein
MRDRIRLIGFLARAFSFLAVFQFLYPVLLIRGWPWRLLTLIWRGVRISHSFLLILQKFLCGLASGTMLAVS